jgi:hypothetical protein
MKLIKGLTLLSFIAIISGSCFDPPEFPIAPQIEYEDIQFKGAPFPEDDSLILFIRFKDGDGDLGLSSGLEDNLPPFNSVFFYQESNGDIEPLVTEPFLVGSVEFDLLKIPNPEKGKLVVFRTSKKPEYPELPNTFHCSSYEFLAGAYNPEKPEDGRRLLIEKGALVALDDNVNLVDSFPRNNPEFYQIKDSLYYTRNPDHYNIEVDFLVKEGAEFVEFDWHKEYCSTFDGRFPVLVDGNSVDGTLRYGMNSIGLEELFSIKTLKLRVSIKDRARNRSNVIETPEFTLL